MFCFHFQCFQSGKISDLVYELVNGNAFLVVTQLFNKTTNVIRDKLLAKFKAIFDFFSAVDAFKSY